MNGPEPQKEGLAASPLQFLYENLERRAESMALFSGQIAWTWRELHAEAQRFAAALARAGVAPRSGVAYASDETAEGFAMLLGIWLADCVASPLNLRLPKAIILDILDTLKPQAILVGQGADALADGLSALTALRAADLPPARPTCGAQPEPRPAPDAAAAVLFTSGTTGRPKGVVATHQAMALNALRTAEALSLNATDRILINTPHYYTSAISHLLTLACRGGSLVSWRDFLFWNDFAQEVARRGCTGFGGAPAHFVRLFSASDRCQRLDLRFLVSSGDHLPQHLALDILRVLPGVRIYRIYGLSEVAGRLCILAPELLTKYPDSVGRPLPGMDVAVKREDGLTDAGPGEVGEVHVSGNMLSREYLGNQEATQALQDPRGFSTGDYGFLDAQGLLYLCGRKDDVFKSAGEKVSCLQIQQELMRLGVFEDLAVLPVEDELLGKVAKVFYVTADHAACNRLKILRELGQRLPNSSLPRHFEKVEAIPRTGSGKVDRKALLATTGQAKLQGEPG